MCDCKIKFHLIKYGIFVKFSISEKDTLIHVKATVSRKDFERIGMTREDCANSYRSSKLFLETDVSEIETRGGNINELSF